jgi:hypothetical protein
MKKLILLFALVECWCCCQAQTYVEIVYDPQYSASVAENAAVLNAAEALHNNYLGKINNDLNNINANVGSVVLAQNIIYNGLSNVNSVLKNGLAVKDMAVIVADINNYLGQCVSMARGEPYLLLFASNFESTIRVRALALVTDVSGYILKEGSNILADYNGRDQLMRTVSQQLQIIDGLAYGAWRAMYWAKQRRVIASLNPYAGWINKDKNFVEQIIANAKYLKQ